MDLTGKVAFITGGVSGIGLGIAKACLGAGMHVVATYRRADHLASARAKLGEEGTAGHFDAVNVDVSDAQEMLRTAEEVEDRCGPVFLLCNNAAVNLFTPIDAATRDDWEWVMRVNLFGVINGLVAWLPKMKARRSGHILNTGSMASFISGPSAGVYTASKFAVRGLTECLRYSLAPYHIGVSLLSPGLTRTNIHESGRGRTQEFGGATIDAIAEQRIKHLLSAGMDPDEVGRRALEGVLRNELYIFTHPEFKDELDAISQRILTALPNGEADPQRLALEDARRAAKAAAER